MSFDAAVRKYSYELVLCRPNREQVGIIEYSDISFNPMFDNFNVIDVTIPYLLADEKGGFDVHPLWDLILPYWLIYLEIKNGAEVIHAEYMYIENPTSNGDGTDKKTFRCSSEEKLYFNSRMIDGFDGNTPKRLYDSTNKIDERDNLPLGIVNYICDYKLYGTWKVNHVDKRLLEMERLVSCSGSSATNMLTLLGERFGCFFVFDNVNKTINMYEREIGSMGVNRGLIFADGINISGIEYIEDTSGIKTRVYVNGKNSATIAQYNITGQRYVDDFSAFMNEKYMSAGLIEALSNYNALIEALRPSFNLYADDSTNPTVVSIRNQLTWELNFTKAQIEELNHFIFEEIVPLTYPPRINPGDSGMWC